MLFFSETLLKALIDPKKLTTRGFIFFLRKEDHFPTRKRILFSSRHRCFWIFDWFALVASWKPQTPLCTQRIQIKSRAFNHLNFHTHKILFVTFSIVPRNTNEKTSSNYCDFKRTSTGFHDQHEQTRKPSTDLWESKHQFFFFFFQAFPCYKTSVTTGIKTEKGKESAKKGERKRDKEKEYLENEHRDQLAGKAVSKRSSLNKKHSSPVGFKMNENRKRQRDICNDHKSHDAGDKRSRCDAPRPSKEVNCSRKACILIFQFDSGAGHEKAPKSSCQRRIAWYSKRAGLGGPHL